MSLQECERDNNTTFWFFVVYRVIANLSLFAMLLANVFTIISYFILYDNEKSNLVILSKVE